MVNTKDYIIKSEISNFKLPSPDGHLPIGIDIGYSSVKGFTPERRFVFPSFVRELKGQLLAGDSDDIIIKDMSDEHEWIVGKNAIDGISSDNTSFGGDEWYARKRYLSKEYRILVMAALGMAFYPDEDGKMPEGKPAIQTGLPPAYLEGDSKLLKKAFSGKIDFTMRLGLRKAIPFHFNFSEEDIAVMPQPMGTLYSVITKDDGTRTEDWKNFFSGDTIIFDGGFGTLDIYTIRGRQTEAHSSFDSLGMHEVFKRTSAKIMESYGEDVPIHALICSLGEGTVTCFDEENISTDEKPIGDFLASSSAAVADEAISKMLDICKPIKDYRNLIVTGGTGAAWIDIVRKRFEKMPSMSVISGNRNDSLDPIYSNVRGYYFFCCDSLRKADKKAKTD